MRVSACVAAVLSSAAMSVSAQNFIDLDFDQARVPAANPFPPTQLPWADAAPGWGHSDGDSTENVYFNFGHAGYSQFYVLLDAPFGAASGTYGFGLRNGTFHEQEPRGNFIDAYISQTGTLRPAVTSVSLLTSSDHFSLTLNGQAIAMRPVGLDPTSPTYDEDVSTYVGEWTGDVSAFAGQVVALQITDLLPPTAYTVFEVDQIQFLPIPETSSTSLIGAGLLAVLIGAARRPTRRTGRCSNLATSA